MVGYTKIVNTNLSRSFLDKGVLWLVFGDRLTFVELVMILLLSSIVDITITFCSVLVRTTLFKPIRFDVGLWFAIITVVKIDFILLIFDSVMFSIRFYVLIVYIIWKIFLRIFVGLSYHLGFFCSKICFFRSVFLQVGYSIKEI